MLKAIFYNPLSHCAFQILPGEYLKELLPALDV